MCCHDSEYNYFEDGIESAIKHLWLNNILGVELSSIIKLKSHLKNVWNVYDAGEKTLSKIVPQTVAEKIIRSKAEGSYISEMYHKLCEKNISVIYPERSIYPDKLRHIFMPPQLLYVKGRIKDCLNEYNKTIGIVGTRKPSVYGQEICRYFSDGLAKAGFNIVSGMARGIDGIAHKCALDNGVYTVAVLGSGINVAYPRSNIELYSRIEQNGAVISEYGLDVKPNPWQFPIRNRIISGMSDGVLVVEATLGSGSLITAEHANEQGKTVYAVPGRLMDKNCEGTNNILREGAICVIDPKNIMEDMLGVSCADELIKENDKEVVKGEYNETNISIRKIKGNDTQMDDLNEEEKLVISCLSLEPVYIDDIIQKVRLGVTKTIGVLYGLENKKRIKQQSKGYYILYI